MDNIFEEQILQIFTDIVYLKDKSETLISIEKVKENGEVKVKTIKKEIRLKETDCDNFNSFISSISSYIINQVESEKVDFYPKNIFQRLLKLKSKELNNKLCSLGDDNYIICSNELKLKSNIIKIRCENIKTHLIIGKKSSTIYLQTINSKIVGFSIETESFRVISLI